MASVTQYSDFVNGGSASKLVNWLLNPLTTVAATALAAGLGAGNVGLTYWDTTTSELKAWNGVAFVAVSPTTTGPMHYLGTQGNLTTEPVDAVVGDVHVMTVAGVLTFAGITFAPSADVQVGDLIVKRDATNYDIIQGNAVQATETVSGIAEVATQVETNAGLDDLRFVTPLKLTSFVTTKAYPRSFLTSAVNLIANTAFAITFPEVALNKDNFHVSVKDSAGLEIYMQINAVNTTGFTVTSAVTLANVTVFTTYL